MLSKTMRLAVGNAKNKTAEWLYIKFGVDYTRPVQIYGLVNRLVMLDVSFVTAGRKKMLRACQPRFGLML